VAQQRREELRSDHEVKRLALVVSSCALPAWACSGPGAADAIARATLVAVAAIATSLGVTIALGVLARRRGGKRRTQLFAVGLLALLIHPGVWMSATSGDCGAAVMLVAPIYALLHVGLVLLSRRGP
jgi:hypothetical protein